MKIVFTTQALESLDQLSKFLFEDLEWPLEKLLGFRTKLLDRAMTLETSYKTYQQEEYLDHLNLDHRRLIEGQVKIIYRFDAEFIYITDFFDTRQDPSKMKP